MTRRTYLRSILLALFFPRTFAAQSRAYAKFGPNGETVGLYKLMKNSTACGAWQVFEGAIAGVGVKKRDDEIDYRFALEVRGGRNVAFHFTIGRDELSSTDVLGLLGERRRVKVRACRTGRIWVAEDVTRL